MNASPEQTLVKRDEAELPVATILQVIERAAANPQVDIDKMERLLQMQERILARSAEQQFAIAMTAAQSEMGRISADASNPQTHSKYASYARLDSVLRPIYTKHGFSLSFDEADAGKPEYVRVICHVSHVGGYTRTYTKDMPADGKGAKGGDVMTKTHAAGAAMSYAMRYLLKGIFNVAVGEEDIDGNRPPAKLIDEKQIANIMALLTEVGTDKQRFLNTIKCAALADIPTASYPMVIGLLEAKRRRTK